MSKETNDLGSRVAAAVKNTIAAHGPIRENLIGSVTKRILGELRAFSRDDLGCSNRFSKRFKVFYLKLSQWSDDTFGKKHNPIPSLKRLRCEVDEVISSPSDKDGYSKCLMLILDSHRRQGGTLEDLLNHTYHTFQELQESYKHGEIKVL